MSLLPFNRSRESTVYVIMVELDGRSNTEVRSVANGALVGEASRNTNVLAGLAADDRFSVRIEVVRARRARCFRKRVRESKI